MRYSDIISTVIAASQGSLVASKSSGMSIAAAASLALGESLVAHQVAQRSAVAQ